MADLLRKIFVREDNTCPQRQLELMKSIIDANRELKLAIKNFESAEAELIDYYSYQIKANKAKLDYLIREVKEIYHGKAIWYLAQYQSSQY